MKQIVGIIILSWLLFGCSSRETSGRLLDIGEGTPIEAHTYAYDLIMYNPLDLAVVEDKLLLFQHTGEDVVLMIDRESGKPAGRWGKRGSGPWEYTYAMYWGCDAASHSLYLYDPNQRCLRSYSWDMSGDSLSFRPEKEQRMEGEAYVLSGTVLPDRYAVASASFFSDKPCLLLDSVLRPVVSFGGLPGQDAPLTDLRTYIGSLSSYGDSFAFGMLNLGYLSFYSRSGSSVAKEWEVFLEEPAYRDGGLDTKRLKQGFISVKMTEHYIFCSYCGLVFDLDNPGAVSRHLLVFDHQGKLVRHLLLDREIGRIAVSEDESTVYAVAYEPDICIVRYFVGDLLK